MKRFSLIAGAALLALGFSAGAANLPLLTGPQDPSQLNATINALIQSINGGVTPQSMGSFSNFRNYLDNGGMVVQQRGTGTATAATTAGCAILSYAADRWCMDVNVTSGAGQLTPITATPSPPPGFVASLKMVRNSGALLQPQCTWQEVPSADVTTLQGQPVMFSAYIQALAGLAADQGASTQTAQLVIITGTGSDQGLGALRSAVGMTASPAITPVWTGLATLQTTTAALPVTPGWNRYNGAAVIVPTTVTELAVGVCFTPTAAGAGTTDGIAFTGAQLEVLGANSLAPSSFEFRPKGVEVTKVGRYFQTLTEPAAGAAVPVNGTAISATVSTSTYTFPVTMDIAPVFQNYGNALSATTWTLSNAAVNNVLATTFIVTKTANTPSGASLTITTTGMTAGSSTVLLGAGGGDVLSWSADF